MKKINLKKSIIFTLLCLFTISMSGQNISVRNTVTNDAREPLIGATVRIQGSSIGTMTDYNGDYEIETLIFQDSFTTGLNHWIIEVVPDSAIHIGIIDEQLVIDTDRGVTVWLNKELSGNILIRYKRRIVMEGGPNDRLSDMNQFWMAVDPRNSTLFTRDGSFKEYDSLLMYYAGIGGNNNKTTRFRKYTGDGNRVLIHDLTDKQYLLRPNHDYLIEILVKDGITKLFVDCQEFFHYEDEKPLTKGYFGIRTTSSRQIVDDVKIFKLK